jgi:hypothetical protein
MHVPPLDVVGVNGGQLREMKETKRRNEFERERIEDVSGRPDRVAFSPIGATFCLDV